MDTQSSLGKWLRSSLHVGLTLVAFGVVLTALCCPPLALAADPIEVTTTGDDGSPGTLRWAITQANADPGPDAITFTPALSGTIGLLSTLPAITDALDILGPGADVLAVSGDNAYRVLEIGAGTPVTITALTVRDGRASIGAGIYTAGTLVLSDTSVISNTANEPLFGGLGGGVYVAEGSATLSGGQISDNTADGGGGGVFVAEGSATISGGQISGNTAANSGGGVCIAEGSATLSGGQISGNTAGIYGGGVHLRSGGTVTVSGGQISGNTANHGGGVFLWEGMVTISGGQISGNTATHYGGGAYVSQAGATIDVSDGQIGSNTATYGGGVYLNGGTAILTGGRIVSNTAMSGGGVYVDDDDATVDLSDGQIGSNTAAYGGGLYLKEGTAILTGGRIVSNTAMSGGGVYVDEDGARIDLSDGQIGSNTATYGGGVYLNEGTAILGSGQIMDNMGRSGGGVYVSQASARLEATGGHILRNSASLDGASAASVGLAEAASESQDVGPTAGAGGGGGIFVLYGTAQMTGTHILSNSASIGGGAFVEQGTLLLTGTRLLRNTATTAGGALHQFTHVASVQVSDSCIIGNSATSVHNASDPFPADLTAMGNWWGTVDGPSGAGPGHGDSVSDYVDYSGFLTEAIEGCSTVGLLYLPVVVKDYGTDR